VVTGRNEADKLPRAVKSVLSVAWPIVYVDSGSTDGSSDIARSLGVDVVDLDGSRPFSVARGRNEGYRRALAMAPDSQFVQFVDADSEICPSWLDAAQASLERDARAAAVFGRLREKRPDRTIFNRLYQAEFDAHFAQDRSVPGMSMMRLQAIVEAGGFAESMSGFEDTELSFRFRESNWRIVRIETDMAVHDARMATARQWWKRQLRGGFARGQEYARRAQATSRYGERDWWSIWFWGLLLPVFIIVSALPTRGWTLWLLMGYVAMALRIRRGYLRRNAAFTSPGLYAASLMMGKLPQAIGLAQFELSRLPPGRQGRLG
jgi:glycosyltransferase involved in cell wall biosynthesis